MKTIIIFNQTSYKRKTTHSMPWIIAPPTFILVSLMVNLDSGRESLEVIQGWERTCAADQRWLGSTWSIRRTRSLAEGDTESQLPPLRGILPSPIRARICWGVSSGPLANGVVLHKSKTLINGLERYKDLLFYIRPTFISWINWIEMFLEREMMKANI